MSCLIIGSPWDNLELLWGETQQNQSIPQYITIRMPDNAFIFHVLTFQWPVRKRGRLGRLLVGFTAWITLWYREGVTSNNAWQNDIAQLIGKHWVFHKHPGLKNAAFKNQLYLLTWCSNVHPMTDCNGSRPSIRIGSHDTTTNPHTSLEDLEPSASCSVHFEIPCTIPNLRDLVKANDLNSCQRLNQSHLLEFVSHSRFGYIRNRSEYNGMLGLICFVWPPERWHVMLPCWFLHGQLRSCELGAVAQHSPFSDVDSLDLLECLWYLLILIQLLFPMAGFHNSKVHVPFCREHSKISQFRSPYIFTLSVSPLALLLKFTSSWARVAASWASRPPVV